MKNLTPLILIILAIGLFFTFTEGKIEGLKTLQATNAGYLTAINNSQELIKERDSVLATYNTLSDEDKTNLDKLLPDNIDNVRLMIDVNNIASRHGITLEGLSTSADGGAGNTSTAPATSGSSGTSDMVNPVSISFSFNASYQNFLSFLKDIESSLRILDVSSLSVSASPTGTYSYTVQLQTYWLSQ